MLALGLCREKSWVLQTCTVVFANVVVFVYAVVIKRERMVVYVFNTVHASANTNASVSLNTNHGVKWPETTRNKKIKGRHCMEYGPS